MNQNSRKGEKMLVFVCSPLRGDRPYTTAKFNKNLRNAAKYSARVVQEGHTPITPHLYFSSFLDDHKLEDRRKAKEMARELLTRCDEVWVFADSGISEGMKSEINLASEIGKAVRYK